MTNPDETQICANIQNLVRNFVANFWKWVLAFSSKIWYYYIEIKHRE